MKSRFFRTIALNIIITLLILALIEGGASLFLSWRQAAKLPAGPVIAEAQHTHFDSLLGWINQPSIRIEDMYGKGSYLATNAQGFRNEEDIEVKKNPGMKRILCLGDSFTLGYGVNNVQTWCHLLSQYIPQLEVVNMGQGGYGIDQAYLWYQRDGIKLEHDLVVFAFITTDFFRLQTQDFYNHPKPFLTLKDDRIEVHTPAKGTGENTSVVSSELGAFIGNLQITKFFQKLRWRLKLWSSTDGVLNEYYRTLVTALFRDLKELTSSNHAQLLLVHLPKADDAPANPTTDGLRATLGQIAAELGLTYVDVVEPLQELPSVFDQQILFQYGNNHFNADGNQFVARNLQEAVQQTLARTGNLPGPAVQ